MAKRDSDIIKSRGVGLKQSEWAEIDQIAAELDTTPHSIAAYGVRYFLKAWREGKVKPQTHVKKTQTLPDL
jgi:LDH2 family malate/lactate/ureidoglycolate dehydrogenase